MTTRFRDFKVSEYWNLAWPFVVVLVLGAAVHFVEQWICHHHLLAVFGDALLVAGTIGLTLELFAVRFLIQRVAADVSGKLAGRGLPEEMRILIHELVETHIVRTNYVKSYRFSEPDNDGHVSIDLTVHYTAENYSPRPERFSPSIQEETFYSPQFKHIEYGLTGKSNVLTPQQIEQLTTIDPDTKVKSLFAPEIVLPPHSEINPARCKVLIRYSLKMRDQYSDVTNFGWPTVGATIELEEIPEVLQFLSAGDASIRHVEGSTTWYFDRPFLVGQHIRTWWFRKPQTKLSISQMSGRE